MANATSGQGEDRGHWNFGDSVGVVALILGVLAVILVPPTWVKLPLLVVVAVGIGYCVRKSHWTHQWPTPWKVVTWIVCVVLLIWALVAQLDEELKAKHSHTLLQTASAGLYQFRAFCGRPMVSKLFWVILGATFLRVVQLLASRVRASNSRRARDSKAAKGFLDYKLQAENAVTALPGVFDSLTRINATVVSMIERKTRSMQAAVSRSTGVQIRIVATAARKLDHYSRKMEAGCRELESLGVALHEGMSGWLGWMRGQSEAANVAAPLVAVLEAASESIGQTIRNIGTYIRILTANKGVSAEMNSALDRHIKVSETVRAASARILADCEDGLRTLRQAGVPSRPNP